jgi:hypothetical protein
MSGVDDAINAALADIDADVTLDIHNLLDGGKSASAIAHELIVPLNSVLAVQQQRRHATAAPQASPPSRPLAVVRPQGEPALTTPPPIPTDRTKPHIAILPASKLFADPAYQRPLDELRVSRMVAEFDPTLLGVLEVSERSDGRYALIDGQHRWAVAIQASDDDDTQLVCNVHRGLSPTDEARLFYEIDAKRRNLTGWDRWWARRGSGDPAVLAIEEVVAKHGLQVAAATKDGTVRATRACEWVVELGGLGLLDQALNVVLAGFGNTADALDGELIHGTAMVLHYYTRDEVELQRLVEQLQTIPPRQVKARAVALREAQKGTMPRLVAAVIIDRYNAGKGSKAEDFIVRVAAHSRPQKQAPGGKVERRRQAILEWAERHGRRSDRLTKEVVAAYDAATALTRQAAG